MFSELRVYSEGENKSELRVYITQLWEKSKNCEIKSEFEISRYYLTISRDEFAILNVYITYISLYNSQLQVLYLRIREKNSEKIMRKYSELREKIQNCEGKSRNYVKKLCGRNGLPFPQ